MKFGNHCYTCQIPFTSGATTLPSIAITSRPVALILDLVAITIHLIATQICVVPIIHQLHSRHKEEFSWRPVSPVPACGQRIWPRRLGAQSLILRDAHTPRPQLLDDSPDAHGRSSPTHGQHSYNVKSKAMGTYTPSFPKNMRFS